MSIIAFAGSSLTADDRARHPDVDWRPPAQAGDLLRLDPSSNLNVCLIDGYFDHRPAVRHKEILYLLAGGVGMFGAASIGALRAAEMDGFGMVGVGAIYRAFVRGALAGDDEVALVHAGADWGWRALSVPLVEMRATLVAALRAHILTGAEARAWLDHAAAIHYVDRDWPAILAGGGRAGNWLQSHHVELKREDALACLAAASIPVSRPLERPDFVRTVFVDALARELGLTLAVTS